MEDDNNNQIDNTMYEDTKITDLSHRIKKHKKSSDSDWPGAFGIFTKSMQAMKVNGWYILGLIIIGSTITGILASIFHSTNENPSLIANIFAVMANAVIGLMIVYLTFAGINSIKKRRLREL